MTADDRAARVSMRFGFACSVCAIAGGRSCRKQAPRAWIRVVGELDLAIPPPARDALRAESQARRIVLDLRELAFLDALGVHVIMDASHRLRQSRRPLVLPRGPSHVDGPFALTGTTVGIDIVDLDPPEPPAHALRRTAPRTTT